MDTTTLTHPTSPVCSISDHRITLALVAALSTSLAACGGEAHLDDAHESPVVVTSEHDLYALSTTIWPTSIIEVCWENPTSSDAQERSWTRAAIARTWEAVTPVTFIGWGTCTASSMGVRIRIQDVRPKVHALGTGLDGLANGMELNFSFQTWGCGSNPCSFPYRGYSRQDFIEIIAVHEFGHALGLAHEHNRPDRPWSCTDAPAGTYGDTMIGSWDLDSVMNYCNPNWSGHGNLSTGDINGIQYLYGHLDSSIVNYGGAYREASYDAQSNIISVGGLIRKASNDPSDWTSGAEIGWLPEDARPNKRHIFTLNQHNQSARVDVHASGLVTFQAGDPDYAWLSLSGIVFSRVPTGAVSLATGVSTYGSGYADPSYTHDGDVVVLEGLVKRSGGFSAGTVVGTVPAGYRPAGRMIFTMNQHTAQARVDVLPNGQIIFVTGSTNSWLSLSGISYAASGATAISVGSGLEPYGSGYEAPSSVRQGDLVVVNGLMKQLSGSWSNGRVVATLPADQRPRERLIFTVNQHTSASRVDVMPNGDIVFVTGASTVPWLSLSGISFQVD